MPMALLLAVSNPYIPWDTNLFLQAINLLRQNLGSAINIGFWIFIAVTGVYLIFKVVGMLGG